MSRRITTQTQIQDKGIACSALDQQGISYEEIGNQLVIKSGKLANVTIDLTTGLVSAPEGGTQSREQLGILRQYYAETKLKRALLKEGHSIESRHTAKNGDIILISNMA